MDEVVDVWNEGATSGRWAMFNTGCGLKENKWVGYVWSGATLWTKTAWWNERSTSGMWAMFNIGCGHFKKQEGWVRVVGRNLVEWCRQTTPGSQLKKFL